MQYSESSLSPGACLKAGGDRRGRRTGNGDNVEGRRVRRIKRKMAIRNGYVNDQLEIIHLKSYSWGAAPDLPISSLREPGRTQISNKKAYGKMTNTWIYV